MLAVSIRKLSLSVVLIAILGASALGAGLFTPAQSSADVPSFERPVYPEYGSDDDIWAGLFATLNRLAVADSQPRCITVLKHSYIGTAPDGTKIYVDYWVTECY